MHSKQEFITKEETIHCDIHRFSSSHADFGAATHPGVGGSTHRRRATFDRCQVREVVLRVVVCGVVLAVCLCEYAPAAHGRRRTGA